MTVRFLSDIARSTVKNVLRNRFSLFLLVFCLFFWLKAGVAVAVGTAAGSIISNVATVTYTESGTSFTKNSNTVTLVVDDKVSFTLTSADAANVTITPGGRAYMTYILNNSGNAPHDFTLSTAITGSPTLNPAIGPIYFADTAGTIPLPTEPNANGLPYISNLSPDTATTVYMFITAPAQLQGSQKIDYVVTAEAYQPANLGVVNLPQKASTQAAADASADKNTNPMTRYIALADGQGNGGDTDRDGRYAIIAKDGNGVTIGFLAHTATVNVVKSVTITDGAGGNQPKSGATLHYTLSVSTAGTGTVFGVIITDPLPTNTTYTAGTLKLNGTRLTDTSDGDSGDVIGTPAGTVTVKLGDMLNTTPVQTITFDVKID